MILNWNIICLFDQSGCYTLEGEDEAHEFARLKQSMEMVGFSSVTQKRYSHLSVGNTSYWHWSVLTAASRIRTQSVLHTCAELHCSCWVGFMFHLWKRHNFRVEQDLFIINLWIFMYKIINNMPGDVDKF